MPRFHARYIARNGRRGTVRLDAIDLASLSEHIESSRKGYIVEIRRVTGRSGASARVRIASSMLLAALDSLELMLVSGVRINTALRTLAECAPPGNARRLWTEAVRLIEESGSFGESLRQFPKVFNEPMVGVITAHETAGRLADGVRHVRDYVAQMQEIRRESVRGLAYPALVSVAGLASSLVLCVFTLPRFSRMLRDIGVTKTNRITGFFFGLSDFVVRHPGCAALALCLPPAAAWVALRPRFRPAIDSLMLRLPIARRAVEALSMARICVTYQALSESGIRVVEALEFCAAVAGNAVYSRGISRVIGAVRENATVGAGFDRAGVFSPEVVLAVKSGEGALPQVFARLADYYTSESKHRVALALRMIEPVMLVLVLAWVFGVALAVVLPVVEVVNEIH
jgi:type II secretory pathway component PulF